MFTERRQIPETWLSVCGRSAKIQICPELPLPIPGSECGETPLPSGETPLPSGETPLPNGETPLPRRETPFPSGESPLPSGEPPLPTGFRGRGG